MRSDPDPHENGGCAVCGKPRGRTVPKTGGKQARHRLEVMLAADPFCSAKCARVWHEVEDKGIGG